VIFLGFESVIFPLEFVISNRKISVPLCAKSKFDTNSRTRSFFIVVVLFISENTKN
jgi:hypothetical protein